MKTIKISLILILSMITIETYAGKNDGCKKSDIRKEAKKRAKAMKKQGYEADINQGTAEAQFEKRLQLECETFMPSVNSKREYKRYTFESFVAKSLDEGNALSKSRDGARAELGKNAGGAFKGIMETEGYFVNGSEEDISNEIVEAAEVFDQVFENELNKNEVVTRFIRYEKNRFITINVTISIDNVQLVKDIKKLKKEEIKDRIERVRRKKETAFRD